MGTMPEVTRGRGGGGLLKKMEKKIINTEEQIKRE